MGRSSSLLAFASVLCIFSQTPAEGESMFSRRSGDVMFGALFPITRKDNQGACKLRRESAIWIRALNFALEEINNQKPPRYNVSFGVEVRDTCTDEKRALEQSLELVRVREQGGLVPQREEGAVLGVIWDSAGERVATLLDLFKVPHVSFTARWPEFARREDQHSTFSFPPVSVDYYQALALADLVRHFAWWSVSLVYSRENARGFRALQHVARTESICVATTVELSDQDVWNASTVFEKLKSERLTRVVILLTTPQHSARLLEAQESGAGQFTWLLADGHALCSLERSLSLLEGSLALVSHAPIIDQLHGHEPTDKLESQEAWQHVPAPAQVCESSSDGTTVLPRQRQVEAQTIVNSVYMLFHAFWRLVDISCQGVTPEKHCREQLRGALLHQELNNGMKYMYTHRVEALTLQPLMTQSTFSLINIRNNSRHGHVTVGSWEGSWNIDHKALRWRDNSARAPQSSCAAQCRPGYIRVPKDGSPCCWTCASCNYKQFVEDNYTCADCARGYWPSRDYRKCEFQWRRTLFDCLAALVAMVLVFSFLVL